MNSKMPKGNFISIQCDDGFEVTLAHLKQKSLSVQKGSQVTKESFLGNVGNSGNSSEPHLKSLPGSFYSVNYSITWNRISPQLIHSSLWASLIKKNWASSFIPSSPERILLFKFSCHKEICLLIHFHVKSNDRDSLVFFCQTSNRSLFLSFKYSS